MAKNFKSGLEDALNRWRTDQSLRWLVLGTLLSVGLTLLLLHQLR